MSFCPSTYQDGENTWSFLYERSYACKVCYCLVAHSAPSAQIYINTTSSSLIWQSNLLTLASVAQCFLSLIVSVQSNHSLILWWLSYLPPTSSLAAHKSPLSELQKLRPSITKDKLCFLIRTKREGVTGSQTVQLYKEYFNSQTLLQRNTFSSCGKCVCIGRWVVK